MQARRPEVGRALGMLLDLAPEPLELAAPHVREVPPLRTPRRVLVQVDGDPERRRDALAELLREARALLHGHARERHERNDVRGADPGLEEAEPPRQFLDDSRNGKWEVIPDGFGSGDFGLEDFRAVGSKPADAARARGRRVEVLHSGLHASERAAAWHRIRGDATPALVVGTRSALFAPLPSVGLIALEDEDDPTWKEETEPRYHARDVAALRARNTADLAILQNDIAHYAFHGTTLERFDGKPVKNIRGVMGLHREPVQLVARADAGIKSVADLRGKRVAVGPLGSGTEANAAQFLEAYGLPLARSRLVADPDQGARAQRELGTAVAVKSAAPIHKTRTIPKTENPLRKIGIKRLRSMDGWLSMEKLTSL